MAKIIHLGLWKLKSETPKLAIENLDNKVKSFRTSIQGIETAYAGPLRSFMLPIEITETYNISPDPSMLARGYNHVLYIQFRNELSRRDYDIATPHLQLAPLLVPWLVGGMEGVLTVDFALT